MWGKLKNSIKKRWQANLLSIDATSSKNYKQMEWELKSNKN